MAWSRGRGCRKRVARERLRRWSPAKPSVAKPSGTRYAPHSVAPLPRCGAWVVREGFSDLALSESARMTAGRPAPDAVDGSLARESRRPRSVSPFGRPSIKAGSTLHALADMQRTRLLGEARRRKHCGRATERSDGARRSAQRARGPTGGRTAVRASGGAASVARVETARALQDASNSRPTSTGGIHSP